MMPKMSPDRRRALSLHRVFAVLATLVLLGSQALSALHYAFVPHHVCALHGVLEDSERTTASPTLPEPASRVAAIPAGDSRHSHEACSVAARCERGITAPEPAVVGLSSQSAVAPSTAEGVDVRLDRAALLARAPKLSPPIV
jgi:hypothetical protein